MKNECTWCGRYWRGDGRCPDCRTSGNPHFTLDEDTGMAVRKSPLKEEAEMIIKNAVIESTSLDIERGFCVSAWLNLSYGGGACQGFGGYALYVEKTGSEYEKGLRGLDSPNYAGHWLWMCMKVAGVEKWEDLKGKTIRVALDQDGFGGTIQGIGHIVNDVWFYPKEDFEV